jgi:hypothetical protein
VRKKLLSVNLLLLFFIICFHGIKNALMSPYVLTLKFGVSIIFLRNINPLQYCNGTRLSVKNLMNNIIEATILNGKFKGDDLLLPCISMIPTDMPIEFKLCSFRYDSTLQWPSTKHNDNCYMCVNRIWKIHASYMDRWSSWHGHALENLLLYLCTHQKEKQKILYSECTSKNLIQLNTWIFRLFSIKLIKLHNDKLNWISFLRRIFYEWIFTGKNCLCPYIILPTISLFFAAVKMW